MMQKEFRNKRGGPVESLVIGLLAGAGFMAWGLWVNWEYGMASRIQVALTQAGIGFAATFGSSELLRWLAGMFAGLARAALLTAVSGWLLINLMVFLAHWVFGTPEIFATMAPGMVTGAVFCHFYGRRVSRV